MKYFIIGLIIGAINIYFGFTMGDWQFWGLAVLTLFVAWLWASSSPRSRCCNAPLEQVEGYSGVKCPKCPRKYKTW